VLAQTHERIEVLVVGDAAGPDTAAAVGQFDDSRVEYVNLTQRYDYPDPHRHWLAATTLARNEGYRRARGCWLFDADDDDHVPDDAIERLLAHAREERLEAVQGTIREHLPDGGSRAIVPTVAQLPLKGAVVHAHPRLFDREHVASAFGVPNDWFRGERMVRAGVRIGFVDWVTYDYYPSRSGGLKGGRRESGADGARTRDLRHAMPTLSQLSYGPKLRSKSSVQPAKGLFPQGTVPAAASERNPLQGQSPFRDSPLTTP
jgi:hypothetical protein